MGWLIGGGYKLLLAGLLVAAIVGLYFRYEHFVEENQRLRDETASLRAGMSSQLRANDQLRGQNEELDKITTKQAQAQADSQKVLAGIRGDLNVLKNAKPEVKAWAIAPMPIDIYNRLLDDGTDNSQGDDQAQSTGSPAGKVPDASPPRPDKPRFVFPGKGSKGSTQGVQQ